MGIYKHQQGNWKSYRVARSIDGKLHQDYFPRTREGYQEAKQCDEEFEKRQVIAQAFFVGYAARWNSGLQRKSSIRRSN